MKQVQHKYILFILNRTIKRVFFKYSDVTVVTVTSINSDPNLNFQNKLVYCAAFVLFF